jgi:hypothetical protein
MTSAGPLIPFRDASSFLRISRCKYNHANIVSEQFSMGTVFDEPYALTEKRIGTSDIVSAPPTTTASAWPELMSAPPDAAAWFAEMQAIVTVWAGTVSGIPANRADSRARLLVFTATDARLAHE